MRQNIYTLIYFGLSFIFRIVISNTLANINLSVHFQFRVSIKSIKNRKSDENQIKQKYEEFNGTNFL
jgi:hypothetical protein